MECWDFYFFPCVNIDGIELGNSTLNAAGVDLFSSASPSINTHTEAYNLLKKLKDVAHRSQIEMIFNVSDCIDSHFHTATALDMGRSSKEFACFLNELCSNFDIAASRCLGQSLAGQAPLLERLKELCAFTMSLGIASRSDKLDNMFGPADFQKLANNFLYLLGIFLSKNVEKRGVENGSKAVKRFLAISEAQISLLSKASLNSMNLIGSRAPTLPTLQSEQALTVLKRLHGENINLMR